MHDDDKISEPKAIVETTKHHSMVSTTTDSIVVFQVCMNR